MADPVESLGAFPIIQLAVAAVVGIGGAIAVWKALTVKPRRTAGEGVEWFLDGPIAKALDRLEGIYRELRQMREDENRHAHEANEKLDELIDLTRDRPHRR